MKKQTFTENRNRGKVKTKIWMVRLDIPNEIPKNGHPIKNDDSIEWCFKLVLN